MSVHFLTADLPPLHTNRKDPLFLSLAPLCKLQVPLPEVLNAQREAGGRKGPL